ncbi:hypothetical protein [Paenibacillus sp. Marseille-Q4541]|nr:hypothetical protein [Paenibacillus sp. Marseille-Q4541]
MNEKERELSCKKEGSFSCHFISGNKLVLLVSTREIQGFIAFSE